MGYQYKGTVTNTTVVDCHVGTEGPAADAGISAGRILGKASVTNTRAFNSTVDSKGKSATANITAGDNPIICNVRINGEPQPDSVQGCGHWENDFCEKIDRLVTPDCRPVNYDDVYTLHGANALLPPAIRAGGQRYHYDLFRPVFCHTDNDPIK
ncbi:hypothetical protein [Endozoicomonas sp. YOMI1]|uniref:hypothetical protein n=1 Tax=Endozoicomonas sp. YOMI1 TaxID=2828739 RepID=UPI0021483528|nr:hypothetical protein [Endozoicomonas sp. YOMI1]